MLCAASLEYLIQVGCHVDPRTGRENACGRLPSALEGEGSGKQIHIVPIEANRFGALPVPLLRAIRRLDRVGCSSAEPDQRRCQMGFDRLPALFWPNRGIVEIDISLS
jgi:hypothetical protein